MAYTVILAPRASEDLHEIVEYVTGKAGAATGRKLQTRLVRTIKLLAMFPEMGRRRGRLGKGVRGVVSAPYITFYRIDGDLVRVLRVLHSSRKITRKLIAESS